jgi:hypothetical protein
LLLRHIGEPAAADTVENAVLATLESGAAVTQDLARQTGGDVEQAASTSGFTDAVIANLGRTPIRGVAVTGRTPHPDALARPRYAAIRRSLVGLDVMVESDLPIAELGASLEALGGRAFRLDGVASRGTRIYPGAARGDSVRWFTARYVAADDREPREGELLDLLGRIAERHHWTHVERLQTFAGEPGYTASQGA